MLYGPSPVGERRTQEQRRAATRGALLAATVDVLVDVGHGGLTTAAVARRAQTSEGALFRYFPTRQELLAAAAEHVYGGLLADGVARVAAAPGPERLDRAVALLWEVFSSQPYAAALELEVAARTNADLRARMEPVVALQAANLRDQARSLFPASATPQGALTLDLLLEAMHGMAVSEMVAPDAAHTGRLLRHLTDLAAASLLAGSEPS
jgi:AcrR family transcriptional regulator